MSPIFKQCLKDQVCNKLQSFLCSFKYESSIQFEDKSDSIADSEFIDFLLFCLAGTPYAGGFFRVKLVLGKDFPQTPPKAYFLTKIFHPNVAANGEICVNTLKKDWKPGEHSRQLFLLCEYYSLNSLSWWSSSTRTFHIEDTVQKILSIVKLIQNLFHLFPARFGY